MTMDEVYLLLDAGADRVRAMEEASKSRGSGKGSRTNFVKANNANNKDKMESALSWLGERGAVVEE